VLRLKVELNNLPALVSLAIGCWFTQIAVVPKSVICGVALVIAVHLFCEARTSHRVLREVREHLLKGIIEQPSASADSSQTAA
jgi:hypothetical protein